MDQMTGISRIETSPGKIVAGLDRCYESIAPLYHGTQSNGVADRVSFAVSSTDFEIEEFILRGCIHKLDIDIAPSLADAKIRVTHEVLPKQGACSQIITVNDKLRVAGFDSGSVLPISNFGPKKTFHCDVRGRLQHHSSPIKCLAADTKGTRLASGSTGGEIVLYDVNNESISFTARTNICTTPITGLSYLRPHQDICLRPNEESVLDGENVLIYSTQGGHIGLLDTRCDLGQRINFSRMMTTEPRSNLTSLCYFDSLPGQVVFFGSAQGELIAVDLRYNNRYLVEQKLSDDGSICRMQKISLQAQENKSKDFLAYTNGTNGIKIIDPSLLVIDERWKCDRPSDGIVRDFCQIGKRIITCGDGSSIGCWAWQD